MIKDTIKKEKITEFLFTKAVIDFIVMFIAPFD